MEWNFPSLFNDTPHSKRFCVTYFTFWLFSIDHFGAFMRLLVRMSVCQSIHIYMFHSDLSVSMHCVHKTI